MTVTVDRSSAPNVIPARNMRPGEAGIIQNTAWQGDIVLCAYETIVSLNNPCLTWEQSDTLIMEVELLPPGTKLTLTLAAPQDA